MAPIASRLVLISSAIISLVPALVGAPQLRAAEPEKTRPIAEAFVAVSMESPEAADLPEVAQDLLFRYPGCEATVYGGRVVAFHSTRMTRAATPEDAERVFWTEHAEAFGISGLNLTLTRSHEIAGGKFTVFAYKQRIDGLPVEYSSARVLVRNGPECAVVYAAGKFVPPPGRPFAPIAVPPKSAASLAGAAGPYKHLDAWTPPELVAFGGEETQWGHGPDKFGDAVRAWRFSGVKSSPGGFPEAYTFYVDASTGSLLNVQSDVHHFDVTGHVSANATLVVPSGNPGEWWNWARPDSGSNYGLVDMPNIRVRIEGTVPEAYAYTDADGMFTIPHSGTDAIQLRILVQSPWYDVEAGAINNENDDYSLLSEFHLPDFDWDLTLNPSPTEFVTAQMNAHYFAEAARELFVANSSWAGLNQPLGLWVNYLGCGSTGFYSTGSVRTSPADPPCSNDAYASVFVHEFGHFVVHQLGLGQESFGEGFGDVCTMMVTDDPWVFRGLSDTPPPPGSRNYEPGEIEYTHPCQTGTGQFCAADAEHCCGRILAGLWWDIREWFHDGAGDPGDFADDLEARTYAQKLFVAWALMTQGGSGFASAHPLTAIEILTVDDDDGDIWNGTPHSDDIEKALDAHQIPLTPGANPPPVVTFQPPINRKSSPDPDNANVVGIDPFAIAAGDLNNDGLQDIVLSCEDSGNVLVYLGASASPTAYAVQAGRAFSVGTSNSRPAKVVLAHMKFEGEAVDNLLDIIVTLQNDNAVQILKNLGSGSFGSGVTIDFDSSPRVANPIGLVVDDFDSNGLMDIAIAGYKEISPTRNQPALGAAFMNADGSVSRSSVLVDIGPTGSRVGTDLCGFADLYYAPPGGGSGGAMHRLAMVGASGGNCWVFKIVNSSPPAFALLASPEAVGSFGICAADLNSDHKTDLAFGAPPFNVGWIKQASFDDFALRPEAYSAFSYVTQVACGKISKKSTLPLGIDHRIDVVVGRSNDSDTRIYIMVNTGVESDLFTTFQFAVSQVVTEIPSPRGVAVHDMNGDGFPDVLTANAGSAFNVDPPLSNDDATEGFSVLLNRSQ